MSISPTSAPGGRRPQYPRPRVLARSDAAGGGNAPRCAFGHSGDAAASSAPSTKPSIPDNLVPETATTIGQNHVGEIEISLAQALAGDPHTVQSVHRPHRAGAGRPDCRRRPGPCYSIAAGRSRRNEDPRNSLKPAKAWLHARRRLAAHLVALPPPERLALLRRRRSTARSSSRPASASKIRRSCT